MEDADKTSTPVSDQARRLFFGISPPFAELLLCHICCSHMATATSLLTFVRAMMVTKAAAFAVCSMA